MIYLVMMGERGGLFAVYYDLVHAQRTAEDINGVVCQMPILFDYRVDEPATAGGESGG